MKTFAFHAIQLDIGTNQKCEIVTYSAVSVAMCMCWEEEVLGGRRVGLGFLLEVELEEELLGVRVPLGPELFITFVNFSTGNLKQLEARHFFFTLVCIFIYALHN